MFHGELFLRGQFPLLRLITKLRIDKSLDIAIQDHLGLKYFIPIAMILHPSIIEHITANLRSKSNLPLFAVEFGKFSIALRFLHA